MRREERVIGTPFTKRRTVREVAETPEEMNEAMDGLMDWSQDPWSPKAEQIEWAEAQLKKEKSGKPKGHKFRPREDAGWYFEEICIFGKIADLNIAKGDAKWVAHAAYHIGALVAELNLKVAREELFLAGLKQRENTAAGVEAWRKGDQADRVAEVDTRPLSVPKMHVFRRIAKREGVTWRAIRTDYYAGKKKLSKPHD